MWQISRMFFNTFNAYGKYFVLNREYFTNPIHMQFSQKRKIFYRFFSAFLKSRLNFENIQKKKEYTDS